MLSFGIFASGTPFFVMAGLYLFYMLINLGIRFNENKDFTLAEEDDKLIEQKNAFNSIENASSVLILSAQDFKDYNNHDVFNAGDNTLPLWPPPQNCRRCIPDKPYLEENLLFSLFSRPPPVA